MVYQGTQPLFQVGVNSSGFFDHTFWSSNRKFTNEGKHVTMMFQDR